MHKDRAAEQRLYSNHWDLHRPEATGIMPQGRAQCAHQAHMAPLAAGRPGGGRLLYTAVAC